MQEGEGTGRKSPSKIGIIVAGMHRSGTSATARVVNLLGADIARDLMPPQPQTNATGFWESTAVAGIHDELLAGLRSAWDDPLPLPQNWLATEFAQRAKRKLAGEIRKEFAGSRAFVAKDPRITRLLPLWLELLDDFEIDPIVVIPFRNPMEVALSLMRRNQFSLERSMLLYACGNLDVELASRGQQRIFVHYEKLLEDWRPFAARLMQMGGNLLPVPPPESPREIDRFLDSSHRHNKSTRTELAGIPDLAQTVVGIYDQLIQAAQIEDDTQIRSPFDRIRDTFSEGTRLFSGIVLSQRDTAHERAVKIRLLEDETARLNREAGARRAEFDRQLTESRGQVGELRNQIARLEEQLAAQRDRVARLDAELAARSRDIATLTQSASWRVTAPLRRVVAGFSWWRRYRSGDLGSGLRD
jgi:hypothetical protein